MTSVTPFSGDDYTSKKAAVIRLLDEGKYTDKEIAKKLLTTWNYVRKIKCQHNKSQAYFGEIQAIDNTIDDYQTNDNQTHVEAVERSPVAGGLGRKINKGQGKAKKDAAYQQRQDTPHFPLDREERKKIWTDFDANKSIVEIVKAYGIAPEIIEREYRSFLRVQGISLSEMQGTIIRKINETRDYLSDRLPKENKEKFERIVIEYKNKGYVGTQQFTTLIEIYKSVGYWQGKESVADVSKGLPKGWKRPNCCECGKPLPNVIYNETKMGIDYIRNIVSDSQMWKHHWACPK